MSRDEELNPESLGRDSLLFVRRVVDLAPGAVLEVNADSWGDAIVFVEAGDVELECTSGKRRHFAAGATLCFAPPVRTVRNCGADSVRLLAVARRTRLHGGTLTG